MTPQVLDVLQNKFGSAMWDRWQVHRIPFWDYVRYDGTNGHDELNFFVNPQGSTDPISSSAKTLEQTNAPKNRSFGQVYFLATQIRTHINPLPKSRQDTAISGDADFIFSLSKGLMVELARLATQGVLEWSIGQKSYFSIDIPFKNCPPGFGLQIFRHASAQTSDWGYWWQGGTRQSDVYSLTPPQLIEPEQNFELTIKFPAGTSPTLSTIGGDAPRVDIGVILDGYIIRPAQ